MNSSRTYEKVVKVSSTGKRLALKVSVILAYIAFAAVWAVVALNNLDILVVAAVAGALLTFGIIKLTWKYLQLEYEYSFSYGELGVAKIYGKRKRKQIVSADIKSLTMIAPATQENIAKAEHFEPDARVYAISSEAAENIWLALTGDKDEDRVLIFFESDERSLDLLKSVNPYAFSKKI